MSTRFLATMLAVALVSSACGAKENRSRNELSDHMRAIEAASNALARSVNVPSVDGAGLSAPSERLLWVLVTDESIFIDRARVALDEYEADREAYLRRVSFERVASLMPPEPELVFHGLVDRRFPAAAKRGGADGHLIIPLESALSRARREAGTRPYGQALANDHRIAIALAAQTPYRTVVDVVYTVGQTQFERLEFIAEQGGSRVAFPVALPGPGDARNELNLSMTLLSRGITLVGSGGKIAPGCETTAVGEIVAIPRRDGRDDLRALAACLRKIKAEFPEEERLIAGADSEIPWSDVVRALNTARANGFPRLRLSAGIR